MKSYLTKDNPQNISDKFLNKVWSFFKNFSEGVQTWVMAHNTLTTKHSPLISFFYDNAPLV